MKKLSKEQYGKLIEAVDGFAKEIETIYQEGEEDGEYRLNYDQCRKISIAYWNLRLEGNNHAEAIRRSVSHVQRTVGPFNPIKYANGLDGILQAEIV
jgi:hypothetical protein